MSIARTRYRFTVDDYEQMIERGILDENDQVELIRGEIIEKMPIGPSHCACVKRLNTLLNSVADGRWIVGVQDPVRLGDSEPEPDISLVRPRIDFYEDANPGAADVLVLIEVADTTLDFDRDVKLPLYAEAGIAEYWIVNLIDSCVEVHRGPSADGTYADSQTMAKGGTVSFQGLGLSVISSFDGQAERHEIVRHFSSVRPVALPVDNGLFRIRPTLAGSLMGCRAWLRFTSVARLEFPSAAASPTHPSRRGDRCSEMASRTRLVRRSISR